jgi:hypothetical protein
MLSISKTKKESKESTKKDSMKDVKKNDKKDDKKYDPLFDNPLVQQFKESLTPEERAKYEKIGQDLYNTVNFETGETEETMEDVFQQLKAMLESGLHPSFLTYEEKSFMENYLGKEWYKEFGYLENDLQRINM